MFSFFIRCGNTRISKGLCNPLPRLSLSSLEESWSDHDFHRHLVFECSWRCAPAGISGVEMAGSDASP